MAMSQSSQYTPPRSSSCGEVAHHTLVAAPSPTDLNPAGTLRAASTAARIKVDEDLTVPDHPATFVIGDLAVAFIEWAIQDLTFNGGSRLITGDAASDFNFDREIARGTAALPAGGTPAPGSDDAALDLNAR